MRSIAAALGLVLLTSSCAFIDLADCAGTSVMAEFEQVGDLVEAATVQSSDVEIGSVTGIELDRKNWVAQVTMCISEGEEIPADVRAVARKTSLLGEVFIDLQAQSTGPPFIEDGAVIPSSRTGKAAELEDVFAKLATVLGAGNLEQINRFTTAQANILRDNAGDLKKVLSKLHRFTGLLADTRHDFAAAIDHLDLTARRILQDARVLRSFLDSFADSSTVLSDQRHALQGLLESLDRFTQVSVRLLDETEDGLHKQFRDLRPVLRTLVRNSANVRTTLVTLATFTEWFPQSMPGDYLQLDVCQAPEEHFGQGTTCPQSDGGRGGDDSVGGRSNDEPDNAAELFFGRALRGGR